MGIKVELKTRTIQYEDIVAVTCDFCGKTLTCEQNHTLANCIEFHKWWKTIKTDNVGIHTTAIFCSLNCLQSYLLKMDEMKEQWDTIEIVSPTIKGILAHHKGEPIDAIK